MKNFPQRIANGLGQCIGVGDVWFDLVHLMSLVEISLFVYICWTNG
ncbi:MAG: hypothetical protein ABJX32_14690 [Tateyamaria sp.]